MKTNGFTLIELLVVLVIISITMTFALLAFGDFGAHRRLMMSAEQFKHQLQLIEHEAMLANTTFAVEFNNTHYRVLRLTAPGRWQPITQHALYREQHFPAQTQLEFIGHPQHPNIIINASGDITPFTLNLGLNHQAISARIIGASDGHIRVESVP